MLFQLHDKLRKPMKISSPHILIIPALLMSLFLTASVSHAQTTEPEPGDSVTTERSFEVAIFTETNRKINLILAIHRPKQIMVILKNAKNAVIHREFLRRTRKGYRQKFDFEGADPGVYQFEISDGWQTVVRRIEVVYLPAIDLQRYIIYGPQTGM